MKVGRGGQVMALDGFDGSPKYVEALRWLGPMAPKAVRRAARVERVVDEMWGATARRRGRFPGDGFDPDIGASGRPPAMYEHLDRSRSSRPVSASLNPIGHHLEWTGAALSITRPAHHLGSTPVRAGKYWVPVPPPSRPARSGGRGSAPEVAEAALFVACWEATDPREPDEAGYVRRGSLHLLDAEGRSIFTMLEVVGAWRTVADVAEAAGVPIRVYAFFCRPRTAEEIAKLLFPRRPGCVRVR